MAFELNQIFEKEYPVESAIWSNENGYFIQEIEPLNGVRRFQICVPKEKSLDELKSEKLNELNTFASRYDSYKCNDMYITSSVGGYRFNADSRSQTNLRGLISVLDDVKSVAYKDYDNEFQSLNKEQMQIIFSECILNGQNLYKQKWDYAEKIKTCETIEELNSIEFNFTMMNFS